MTRARSLQIAARFAIGAIGLLAILGFYFFVRVLWTAISGIHIAMNGALAASAFASIATFVHDQAAIWLTAIATTALWKVTGQLSRATNIEHARSGPFLTFHLNLTPFHDPTQITFASHPVEEDSYDPEWRAADLTSPLLGSQSTLPPHYVNMSLRNDQVSPHGVASNIKVTVKLHYGAPDDQAPHPYLISRTIGPLTLLANNNVEGPIFNVAGIHNFGVEVTEVEYFDISNKRRTAAAGSGLLARGIGGNVLHINRVFEPRKGEYTDAE